ncbi:MAG: HAD family hydrolase [Lautropia sp.]
MPAPALPAGDAIDAITLDLDDTLWPVLPALLAAERAMLDWLRPRAPATARICSSKRIQEIRLLVQMANAERAHDLGWLRLESLRTALGEAGEDPAFAVGAFEVFTQGRSRVTLYADVLPVLARWRERYRLAIITNGNADVDRIGIADCFDANITAHRLGVGKPDSAIFHAACTELGVDPARTLHIGDDLQLDIAGARNAGLHAAWVRRPDLPASAHHQTGHTDEPGYPDLRSLARDLAGR